MYDCTTSTLSHQAGLGDYGQGTSRQGALFTAADQHDGEQARYAAMFANEGQVITLPMLTKSRRFAKSLPFIAQEAANQRVAGWKAEATRQGRECYSANAQRTVISLFDASGVISEPWAEAGYNVHCYDLSVDGEFGDITKFCAELLLERHGNDEVWAILTQPPCTDYARSGARWWHEKDRDGRTALSIELVRQTLRTIELFRPPVWLMENPTGRIRRLNGLPEPRLSFDPWAYGDPYTKRTQLWGRFDPHLPMAPVEPTEGSKMHKLSSSAKYERSLTPTGFAYAFFMANNAEGMPLHRRMSQEFAGIDAGLFERALASGCDERELRDQIEDAYYDNDLETVREELLQLAA